MPARAGLFMHEGSPKKLGKYRLAKVLAKGGMGVVYKAYDPAIGRPVAIKTIHEKLVSGSRGRHMLARFKREAQAAGQLSHPNVVTIFEYGVDGDTAFIAMEYVKGVDIATYLNSGTVIDLSGVMRIMKQVLSALDYCHRMGVIHRDLKPSNIILLADGTVKIVDFGIARVAASELTATGTVLGTPNYMAPEQLQGKPVDLRADIFSTGAILYELLTGRKPFQGRDFVSIMQKVLGDEVEKPSSLKPRYGTGFDLLIHKALAKDREQRFQSAREFMDALHAAFTIYRAARPGDRQAQDDSQERETEPPPPPALAAKQPASSETLTGENHTSTDMPAAPSAGRSRDGWKRYRFAGGLSLPLLVITAFAWWYWQRPGNDEQPRPGPDRPVDVAAPIMQTVTKANSYYALVKLRSDPPGAEVYLDGEEFDVAPAQFELPPGGYQLSVRKPGYAPEQMRLQVEPWTQIQVQVTLREVRATK